MDFTLDPGSPTLRALLQRSDVAHLAHHVILHLRPCDLDSDVMRKATGILRQMNSLQALELHYRVKSPVVEFMRQIAIPSFLHLQSFQLQPEPPEGPEDWKQGDIAAVPILQPSDLPQADELYLHALVLTSNSTPAGVNTHLPTRRLTFKECQIKAPELSSMLRRSPKLTWLECGILIDAEKAREWFDLAIISQGLAGLYKTLKHLCISFELATSTAIDTGNEGPWGIRSSLASMKPFIHMESLEVDFVTLMGWNKSNAPRLSELLPPNLKHLTLTREMALWWGYQWDDVFETGLIREMIEEYVEAHPCHLRELVLHVPEGMGGEEIKDSISKFVNVKIVEDEY